jgi:hypothetical protein
MSPDFCFPDFPEQARDLAQRCDLSEPLFFVTLSGELKKAYIQNQSRCTGRKAQE